MITTVYKCDRCGKEQSVPEQMWNMEIHCRHLGSQGSCTDKVKGALWCRMCVESFGLLPTNPPAPPEQIPKPTVEELIREIIRDEFSQGNIS